MIVVWLFIGFLAVPIIIHLFSFRRAKKLLFSSIRFIGKVSTESKSKTRLKHYLILSSRLVIFLTLLVVLYQHVRHNNQAFEGRYFIYMDNSISQSIENSGNVALNKYQSIVDEFISTHSKSLLFTNDYSLVRNSPLIEKGPLNVSAQLDYTHFQKPRSIIFSQIREAGLDNVLYISDMQENNIDEFLTISLDSSRNYSFVVSELRGGENAFIDTAYLEYSHSDDSNFVLNLGIAFSDEFKEGNLVVKLLSDGRQLSSVIKKVTEVSDIKFNMPESPNQQYEVQISGDAIEYDNTFFLSKGIELRPKVVLVSGDENEYLNNVFGNKDLFQFSIIDPNSIEFSDFENSDLIVFNNLVTLPNGIVNQLSNPKILIFPSDSIDFDSYEMMLGNGMNDANDFTIYESKFDFNRPLFSKIFERVEIDSKMPYGSSFYEFEGTFETAIGLRNENPMLIKATNDVYILSSALDEKYTNFSTHALFLPIMYKLAQQSVNEKHSNNIYYYPNQIITIENNFEEDPIRFTNEGYEVIPEFTYLDGEVSIRIPVAIPPGSYFLVQGLDTLDIISVNLSKSESVMEGLTVEELSDFFKSSSNVSVVDLDNITNSKFLIQNESSSLWKYALILVLLFILTETMLHRYLK